MNKLFYIRQFVQNNNAKHWQYLFLAFFTSLFSAVFWLFLSVKTGCNCIIIPLIAALIQGSISYVFMEEKGEAKKVFFSLTFSMFTFILGKYLLYEHLYDWYLNAYIDKNEMNWNLILFYFKVINIESIELFISGISSIIGYIDILWIVIILFFSLQYMILPFENRKIETRNNHRKTFRKRRFE